MKKDMKILRALGLAVLIVVLRFLMPAVLSGIEGTLVAFFSFATSTLQHGQASVGAGVVMPTF